MNTGMLCALTVGAVSMATFASAGCWSADEASVQGQAVEICYQGNCEQTNMILECAGAWGATIGYANGWAINVEIMGGDVTRTVSLDELVLSPQQLQTLTCRELEAGGDGCRFPDVTQASSLNDALDPLSLIKEHFRNAIGIDAENLQSSLREAGLYQGAIDGMWGPETEAAFADALDWANSRGMQYDVVSEDGFYDFTWAIRIALFDVDSGLIRTPTGNEFLLVTASSQSRVEADQVAGQLDRRLTERGYPHRTYVLLATNGWYAVVGGMYSQNGCVAQVELFKGMGVIPSDSYCAGLDRFDPLTWTN